MARKSIKGYTEKNYYDNTRFRGITATTDPLNEGYFNHMVNFDIADTGQSVTPRKGFKTFKLDKSIPKEAVYFKDPSSDYYIFVWLYNREWSAYKTNFIDEGVVDNVVTTIESFEPLEKYAQIIYDHYQIQRNVLKAKVGDDIKYINFTYRANDTSYENVSYTGNTVTIDIVDTEDIGSIDMAQRNIASTQSIIPKSMQYKGNDVDYNKFPIIYAKTPEGKYAINSVSTLDGIELIPHFELKGESWGYTYDIISTSYEQRYESPLCTLLNDPADKDYNIPEAIKNLYPIDFSTYDNYQQSLSNIKFDTGFFTTARAKNTLTVYVVPKDAGARGEPNQKTPDKTYKDYFVEEVMKGITGSDDPTDFIDNFPTHYKDLDEYVKEYGNKISIVLVPFEDLHSTSYFSEIVVARPEHLHTVYSFVDYIKENNIENITFQRYRYVKPITVVDSNHFLFSLCGQGLGDFNIYTDIGTMLDTVLYFRDPDSTTSHTNQYRINYNNNVHCVKLTYDDFHDSPLFITVDDLLRAKLDEENDIYKKLKDELYFAKGINIVFYIFPILQSNEFAMPYDVFDRNTIISSTNLVSSRQLVYSEHPTYYIETLENEPKGILGDTPFIVFDDRIVTWKNNIVYMSEMNSYYYFKYTGVYNFPERVVKAIAYKDTVLVFTTQNLYCIYPYEYTESVQDGIDDEGKPKYVQQKVIAYASLPVLYNLMVDEKYADAIQVFNQMILFYSADGQLFMIKPTASIDSNTRFSIQYFNKSANDILANYDVYINKRLASYGLPEVSKDDINIRVEVTLNYIKIYYYTNNYTYILIYDVINNYYYTYDTQVVYNIQNFLKTEGYDTIVIESDDNLYFSSVHKNTKNVDLLYNSRTFPIEMELDTGVINLNNHLKKRFRTLHTTYKNIDADDLVYNLEVLVDEVPVYTMHDDIIEVVTNNYETVSKSNEVNLLEDNTVLFKFNDDSLNKIMNHRTNIVSIGKTIRLKTTFKSAGRFKLQGFGLVYKEHQI